LITYFDASALAKRYVEEEHSLEVARLLAESSPATCRFSEVEIASALARRCREGAFPVAERDRALATLRRDLDALYIVELVPEVVAAARELLRRHPLRAADAVQLGSALLLRDRLRSPIGFVAYDERLSAAAAKEGFPSRQSPANA
jgi:hypothetical protein